MADLLLILAGVAGIGTIVERAPVAMDVVRWLGVAFLTWYGVTSLLRARHAGALEPAGGQSAHAPRGRRPGQRADVPQPARLPRHRAAARLAGRPPGPTGRWWFALGACVASLAWFVGLGYGARLLSPLLTKRRAWQVLDVLIGLTMLAIALSLALGLDAAVIKLGYATRRAPGAW